MAGWIFNFSAKAYTSVVDTLSEIGFLSQIRFGISPLRGHFICFFFDYIFCFSLNNVAKAGGSQSQGAKGEAVALYCDPLATPDLASSGFPGRVKK
jgi:hypothetical protein